MLLIYIVRERYKYVSNKDNNNNYVYIYIDTCDQTIVSADRCFEEAVILLNSGSDRIFVNNTVSDPNKPCGCSVTNDLSNPLLFQVFFNTLTTSQTACSAHAVNISGSTRSLVDVSVHVDNTNQLVTLSITGPADVWFGVGFGAKVMADQPWAVIVEGSGDVSERQLADQSPGQPLAPSVTVVSVEVQNNLRSVVLTRPTQGKGPEYYSFGKDNIIDFINAYGSGPKFDYHKSKIASSLALLPTGDAPGG